MSVPASSVRERGLILGRYRPIRPLGSGASGSVWLCWDEHGGRDVAVKMVAREGKAGERAEREARASARLRHPRCLRAYDLAHDDGHVYIAYEYVAGQTLREALRAGALDDATATEAAAQVLDALAHAHARGIVHRDIKPSNVLLAAGEAVDVRLLDFGLAQLDEAETLTGDGDVPGTLAYIAPERLGGEPAVPASDVWAVGVMLWEALAGEHPFWRASVLDTARAIEAGAPPLRALRPDLPKALLDLVDRALSVDALRRPAPRKLAAALRDAIVVRRRGRATPRVPALAHASAGGSALLAAAYAGWSASALPFYPSGWPAALAIASGAVTLWQPRWGAALTLAVPILPLGNHALALAILYGAAAALWLAVFWREPRGAPFPALGAVLAPVGALGLLPLGAAALRSPVRRAAAVVGATGIAAVAAGIRGSGMPFTDAPSPQSLGVAQAEDPLRVVEALARAVAAHPVVVFETVVLGAVAAGLPYAARRGLWGAAALASAMLAATAVVPAASPWPLVVTAWVTFAAVALVQRR